MKKSLFIIPIFLFWIAFATESFPSFPMTIHGNINLSGWVLKVYDGSNQEISSYTITIAGKYWSENATILPFSLNSFNGNITFKATYNWKNYVIDSIDDSNRWDGCPIKSAITFVSKTCRYDLTFKEESNNNGWWGWWWGWGWWGWWGWGWGWWAWITPNNTSINTWTTNTWTIDTWITINSENNQWNNGWNPQEILSNWFTREFNNAYEFAYKNKITTMKDIKDADMNWWLIRIAMAKMLSQYAINILKKAPNTDRKCEFSDVSKELDAQYDNGVTLACQLWIMWVWIDKFRPNDDVTRAEFGTALSRMLYWIADWTDNYYSTHLRQLNLKWIINNPDPSLKELRWYVMLMLMRSAK